MGRASHLLALSRNCPDVIAALKVIQGELKGQDVRFVSFTVDPEHDLPQVLRTTPAPAAPILILEVSDGPAQPGVATHPARAPSAGRPTS